MAQYPELKDRVAVITGGSEGIGAAAARMLARNGVRVVVNGRTASKAERVAAEINADSGRAVAVAGDCSVVADVERLRDAALKAFGTLDIVVACAGGFRKYTPLKDITPEEWDWVMAQNLTSTFLTTRAFLPVLLAKRRGCIITISSNAGRLVDAPLTASYSVAKAAIVHFTKYAARELAPYGVRVNCVAPGTAVTPRVEGILTEEMRQRTLALTPLGRLGSPDDSANVIVFLASDAASYLTGITIDVAGGRITV